MGGGNWGPFPGNANPQLWQNRASASSRWPQLGHSEGDWFSSVMLQPMIGEVIDIPKP
jgi:hypothetical protein